MIQQLEQLLGFPLLDYQQRAVELFDERTDPKRLLLFYRTGAGKTLTALACLASAGYTTALVVAPPTAHTAWQQAGAVLGISVDPVSHAKFRRKDFLLSRHTPLVADEFHMFGGHLAVGWKKLERFASSTQQPVILCSATPNYNDVERCYCVDRILNPAANKGGYLQFLYTHCETQVNPFGVLPQVEGFRNGDSAEEFLRKLPGTLHVPDVHAVGIQDHAVPVELDPAFERYGLHPNRPRLMASQMEARHTLRRLHRVDESKGMLRDSVYDELIRLTEGTGFPVLLFCDSAWIAGYAGATLEYNGVSHRVLTGRTSRPIKEAVLNEFREGSVDVLVGTATLATGTDGLDKVCDTLIILDDTQDSALRRQLLGRILPRGLDTNTAAKQVHRLIFPGE